MKSDRLTRRAALGAIAASSIVPSLTTSQASGEGSVSPIVPRTILRPAMRGIFSGSGDQRAALIEFINEAGRGGMTIEWGPLDVSLDVVAPANGVSGLAVPSGAHWIMHPNTRFRAMPNGATHYAIVNVHNVRDVIIEGGGARLIGERKAHMGSAGEWGHGVNIVGSANVRVSDLIVEDCWGDGFYIGASPARPYSSDVVLERIVAHNNRRQGMSIVSARRLLCIDGQFLDTGGTNPQSGIDIEPNAPDNWLEDVRIVRPLTRNNAGAGISVYFPSLAGTSNRVGVLIEDMRDEGSVVGFSVGYPAAQPLGGGVRFERPVCRDSRQSAMRCRSYAAVGPKVVVNDPVFDDWNKDGKASPTYASAVSIFAERMDGGEEAIGNIVVNRPRYRLRGGDGIAALAISDFRQRADPPTGIELNNPEAMPPRLPFRLGNAADIKIVDPLGISTTTLRPASQDLSANEWYSRFVTPVLSSPITLTIKDHHPVGAETEIVVGGDGRFAVNVSFAPALSLVPIRLGASNAIGAAAPGSRLRIRKTAARTWEVLAKSGAWTPS